MFTGAVIETSAAAAGEASRALYKAANDACLCTFGCSSVSASHCTDAKFKSPRRHLDSWRPSRTDSAEFSSLIHNIYVAAIAHGSSVTQCAPVCQQQAALFSTYST